MSSGFSQTDSSAVFRDNGIYLQGKKIIHDTASLYFQVVSDSNLYSNLGNPGSPSVNFIAQVPEFRINSSSFFLPTTQNTFVLSDIPQTVAHFNIGTNKSQTFYIRHSQRIGNNLRGFIEFNRNRFEGYYNHQLSENSNLISGLRYGGGQQTLKSEVILSYKNAYRQENGGVDDTLFMDNVYRNDKLYLTGLNSAISKQYNWNIDFNNSIRLNKGKNIFSLVIFGNYQFMKHQFSDEKVESYFSDIFIDSLRTDDASSTEGINSGLGFTIKNKKWSSGILGKNYQSNYHNLTFYSKSVNQALFSYVQYSDSIQQLHLSAEVFLYGEYSDDFNLKGNYSRKILAKENIIDFSLAIVKNHPSINTLFYSSNHYQWANVFTPVTTFRSEIVFRKGNALAISVFGQAVQNGVYLDSASVFNQSTDLNFNAGLRIKNCLAIGKHWEFCNQVLVQKTDNSPLFRVPGFAAKSQFMFKGKAWSMSYKTGLDFNYFSKYYANAYNPALSSFYYQDKVSVGNYPLFGLFFEADIYKVTSYIAVQHVTEGLFGRNYFSIPAYPMLSRTLFFGIRWRFMN
ncbi:MAG: putative porin [Flavobacteriales bacterium]|nr:putative porin [Flavobacteriales bacterium]